MKRGRTQEKPRLITAALLGRWPLPEVHPKLGKEGRGNVLVIGGSSRIPGAVILAAVGALRAGAGRIQIATARSVAPHVAVTVPEACVIGLTETRTGELGAGNSRVLHDSLANSDAMLIGPGMRCETRASHALVAQARRVGSKASLIVDAGALSAVERFRSGRVGGELILTPHAGEMATLWGCDREEVLARPLEIARAAAARWNAVVALKGARTFVVAADGTAYCNTAGNVGLGTSGSGDALSGVIAGLCARGASALQAAVWGVFLHAKAGDLLARRIGALGFLARELLTEIPSLLVKIAR
ncbi:MAG TPA: NAD(P)H-hydrate dehydratase [Polyangiaceae bacterium]|nr:NAD(P)H-hydrate dehydratase [Polyangiaceae bacterium]